MSRVAVLGMGYVGVGTAIAFAKQGHSLTCIDTNAERIESIRRGRSPFFDPGIDRELSALVRRETITTSTDTRTAVREAETIFVCVGTPSNKDGSLDDSQLRSACLALAAGLRRRRPRQLVVIKSTVVPGTTETVVIPAIESNSDLRAGEFGVCVSPEFLREGHTLEDSLYPSHIVVGEYDRSSGNTLFRLNRKFSCPKFRTSLRVAEAVKYATNAFLATKVTFANELANLCTRIGLDSDEVIRGMTLDPRINPHHLMPGVGIGGSCLPKDLRAFQALARRAGYESPLLSTILSINERQHLEAISQLEQEIGPLSGKRIALLGLAFKAGTDDVRESKAIAIASELVLRGARVVAYDPMASRNFSEAFHSAAIAESVEEALQGSHACIIQAAWPEFRRLGPKHFSLMVSPVVIDGRRTWPLRKIPEGVRYRRIG